MVSIPFSVSLSIPVLVTVPTSILAWNITPTLTLITEKVINLKSGSAIFCNCFLLCFIYLFVYFFFAAFTFLASVFVWVFAWRHLTFHNGVWTIVQNPKLSNVELFFSKKRRALTLMPGYFWMGFWQEDGGGPKYEETKSDTETECNFKFLTDCIPVLQHCRSSGRVAVILHRTWCRANGRSEMWPQKKRQSSYLCIFWLITVPAGFFHLRVVSSSLDNCAKLSFFVIMDDTLSSNGSSPCLRMTPSITFNVRETSLWFSKSDE